MISDYFFTEDLGSPRRRIKDDHHLTIMMLLPHNVTSSLLVVVLKKNIALMVAELWREGGGWVGRDMLPPAQQGDKKPRLDWINVLRNFVGGRPRDPRYHRHGVLEPIETVLTGS